MPYHDAWDHCPPPSYYSRCPNYPCRDHSCPYECCQLYQYERAHIHPLHRRHRDHHPHSDAIRQHREAKHRAFHLAEEIIANERRAEKEKLEKEAKQKVEDIERGKAEREKDAERGKKAREKQARGSSRKRAGDSESDSDNSEHEDDRLGRSFLRQLRRENERDRLLRGKPGRYMERRWDGKGRSHVSVVTRERVPSWTSCFFD